MPRGRKPAYAYLLTDSRGWLVEVGSRAAVADELDVCESTVDLHRQSGEPLKGYTVTRYRVAYDGGVVDGGDAKTVRSIAVLRRTPKATGRPLALMRETYDRWCVACGVRPDVALSTLLRMYEDGEVRCFDRFAASEAPNSGDFAEND